MATVRRYNPGGVTTQTMNEQINIQTTPEMFSGGAEQVGKNVSKVAELYAKELDRADQVRVLEAKQQMSDAANRFLNDSKTGVLNARGQNSFNSQERYSTEFIPQIDKIKEGLSQRQKEMFKNYEFETTQSMSKSIESHVAKQTYVVDEENSKAFLENEQNAAVYKYTDFGEIENSIRRQKDEISQMAKRNGVSTEVAGGQALEAESRTRTIVIEQLVNSNNSQSAKLYLDSNKDKMLARDVLRLEKLVKDGSDIQTAQAEADRLTSMGLSPKEAIAQANRIEDTKVRDEVKKRVFGFYDEIDKAERLKKEDDYLYSTNLVEKNIGVPPQDLVPKTMWASFSIQERKNLEELSRNGLTNTTDLGTYYDLELMAGSPQTRDKFQQLNLMTLKSKLADGDFKHFAKLQADMRQGKASDELDGIESKNSIVDGALDAAGYVYSGRKASTKDIDAANQFRRAVDQEVVRVQNETGKKINNEQLRSITEKLMTQTIIQKRRILPDIRRRVFELQKGDSAEIRYEDIPKAETKAIESALIRRGIPVSEQNVMRIYSQRIMELNQ